MRLRRESSHDSPWAKGSRAGETPLFELTLNEAMQKIRAMNNLPMNLCLARTKFLTRSFIESSCWHVFQLTNLGLVLEISKWPRLSLLWFELALTFQPVSSQQGNTPNLTHHVVGTAWHSSLVRTYVVFGVFVFLLYLASAIPNNSDVSWAR